MVRILPNGQVDDGPSEPRRRNPVSSGQNSMPREPTQNPTGPAELFHYANDRLLSFGLPRFPVGGYFVEPVHLVLGILALVLFGPLALIAIAIIIYISQQGNNTETVPAHPAPRAASSGSQNVNNTSPRTGSKIFSGTGQRLGS